MKQRARLGINGIRSALHISLMRMVTYLFIVFIQFLVGNIQGDFKKLLFLRRNQLNYIAWIVVRHKKNWLAKYLNLQGQTICFLYQKELTRLKTVQLCHLITIKQWKYFNTQSYCLPLTIFFIFLSRIIQVSLFCKVAISLFLFIVNWHAFGRTFNALVYICERQYFNMVYQILYEIVLSFISRAELKLKGFFSSFI